MHSLLLLLFSLPTLLLSHGILISPPTRAPGPASLSYCGESITGIIKADNQSGIEALHKASVTSKDYHADKCNLLLCKGLQLEDNEKNVQTWSPGEEVVLKVWTRIPHVGWWSVGIVDAGSLLLVGGGSVWGFLRTKVEANMMVDFEIEVVIPKVFPRCAVPGDCVLQWTWFGRVVKQTYESCVDFVVVPESYEVGGGDDEKQKYISQ
ncbi:uncharacterized protein LY89DRAFT_653974 [Mollisia scopiformis]|uniref:Uncharacterized protein n=1 Tax=Mollisia scopiformis TaxID=149040 RepID=A0A194WW74_MOLSC|nr:uncharacterized protein LY89DRAFT_653974 [Mollisia scopiformis]KUJ12220.1 hypothetical protein LY89DRAFT_653974 [Mollisia scopiformis]